MTNPFAKKLLIDKIADQSNDLNLSQAKFSFSVI
jgi:hypothetical protein